MGSSSPLGTGKKCNPEWRCCCKGSRRDKEGMPGRSSIQTGSCTWCCRKGRGRPFQDRNSLADRVPRAGCQECRESPANTLGFRAQVRFVKNQQQYQSESDRKGQAAPRTEPDERTGGHPPQVALDTACVIEEKVPLGQGIGTDVPAGQ